MSRSAPIEKWSRSVLITRVEDVTMGSLNFEGVTVVLSVQAAGEILLEEHRSNLALVTAV
jgi:hypothetical protein